MPKFKHGDAADGKTSVEWNAWSGMKGRCYNRNYEKVWKHYGGRGIKVCDRWLHSYAAFLEDMGRRPSDGHSLDRIDNDGDYCPENCRWATKKEQAMNRRSGVLIGGKTYAQWSKETGIREDTFAARINRGWTLERTIKQPVRKGAPKRSTDVFTGDYERWSCETGIPKQILSKRMRRGWSIERAGNTPVRAIASTA